MDTVVVTGAASAVGRAVARAFAADGAVVVLGDRDADAGSDLAATLGEHASALRTDPRDEYDVERLMERASRAGESSGIDVVAPCDAVYHGPVGETPLTAEAYSAFDDTFRTNVRGVFAAVQEAAPHLAADARVLVPTGDVAEGESPGFGSFAVSKAAAEAVARGFAADADGVAVTRLNVGPAAGLRGDVDADAVGGLFTWAAALPFEDADGARFSLADWRARQ